MDELEQIKKRKIKELIESKEKMEIEIKATDKDFEEKIIQQSAKIPIVVDFWASWCQPCLILSPTLEKLAKEYKGRFILAKVNIDQASEISRKYNIMSIPNVKMFKGGKVVDEFIGAMPEEHVRAWLDKNL